MYHHSRTHSTKTPPRTELDSIPQPDKTRGAIARALQQHHPHPQQQEENNAFQHHQQHTQQQEAPLELPPWVVGGGGGVQVFVPKALVLLSHYPFYDAFREVGRYMG